MWVDSEEEDDDDVVVEDDEDEGEALYDEGDGAVMMETDAFPDGMNPEDMY